MNTKPSYSPSSLYRRKKACDARAVQEEEEEILPCDANPFVSGDE